MTISLEEPRQLILELCSKFTPLLDIQAMDRIEKKIQEQQVIRQPIREASHENIQSWTRKVDQLRPEACRPPSLSVEKHEERMACIEKEEFIHAKAIRELEQEIESLETMIQSTQQQYQAIKKANMEPIEPSETELRLRIYRSFGVSVVETPTLSDSSPNSEPMQKIRIRPSSLNDIHTLVIDRSKYTDFFYTNYVWEMCSLRE
jgi:hypothetical protein